MKSVLSGRITHAELVNAQSQISRDQLAWASTTTADAKELQGYKAGVAAGAREMLSYLKLHGFVEVDHR